MKNMTSMEIETQLIAITKQLLDESGIPHREIQLNASLQRHLGIDSLGRAELFQRIEKAFHIEVPDRLLAEAETLNDILAYLSNAEPTHHTKESKRMITSHGTQSHTDPSHTHTLVDMLLLHADKTPDKVHIYFQNEEGKEEEITYRQLLNSALSVAFSLKEQGLREGETVAIMLPTHSHFFYAFYGILLAGGIPVPIYPPFRMHMLEAYAKTEATILKNAQVRILITFKQAKVLSNLLKNFVPSLRLVTTVDELIQTQTLSNPFKAKGNDFAFIQYTSGSTSDPKGVLLSHANLLANIRAYGQAIGVTPEDVTVSWLPLYHDMGLIGMWLGSLYYGIPLILLTPFSFLNHPERWLWAVHYHRGTLSGAPNFAYELCVRKIDPEMIEGLDLSSWRLAANGAEKVYPRTLEQFQKKFEPYGLGKTTLVPVYGLAESTVCVAVPPQGQPYHIDHVDRKAFEEKRECIPSTEKNALAFVACGKAIPDHRIRIVDEENNVLPERRVGNLQFSGPSSMQGYFNNPEATQAIYHDGWIDSGDLAYIAEDNLYLTGRRKDLIIKAGRNLYPAEIEEIVGVVPGVRLGCVAAFGVVDTQRATEELIIVAETRETNKEKREQIINNIQEAIATPLDIVADQVILVKPHVVPKTSSGKLQRAACKAMYMQDQLGKRKLPPWVQISRLGFQSLISKVTSGFRFCLKVIYTTYVALLMLLSFFPLFLNVYFGSRQWGQKVCRLWARWLQIFSFCPLSVKGEENLTKDKPVIYASNHTSYIDIIILLAVLPSDTRFIAKKELLTMPILNIFLRKLGHLSVDRLDFSKGLADTKQIAETIKEGHSILIFPEGTFGYASGLRPFRLGAFKIATEISVPIVPIAIQGARYILRDDEKLMSPGKVTVFACEPIKPMGAEWQDVTNLRLEARAQIAKYCGEPTLDFIAAEKVAPKFR